MTTVNPAIATMQAQMRQADAETEAVAESRSVLASDFNTFLTLLTTQMKYQDPLNPTDSTQFVAQLAQFSSVEQQINTNRTLTSILGAVSAAYHGSLAEWLGTEVRAVSPRAFDGAPIEVFPEPAEIASVNATLLVIDSTGRIVAEKAFPPGTPMVLWDGTLSDGSEAPKERYGFVVRYGSAQGDTETVDAAVYAPVAEVRREAGEPVLVLDGGATIAASEVTGVRRPQ